MDMTSFGIIATLMFTVVSTVWTLAWWLSRQFSNVKAIVFSKLEKMEETIKNQLEYHEKHDDDRFAEIRNDIWSIRLENATRGFHKKSNGETEKDIPVGR